VAETRVEARADYAYDPLGRLAARTVRPAAGPETVAHYYYDGPELAAVGPGDGGLDVRLFRGARPFRPVSMVAGDESLGLHPDLVGSVRLVTRADGSAALRLRYDSFGRVLSREGDVASPIGFAGQAYDEEAGLSFFFGRSYDAETGLFTSVDPIRLATVSWTVPDREASRRLLQYLLLTPSAQHPYAYAHQNPLRYEDPLGLIGGCSDGTDTAKWALGQLIDQMIGMASDWWTVVSVGDWAEDIITSEDPRNEAFDQFQELLPPPVQEVTEIFQDYVNQRGTGWE
jgi:RHS repeat-associated protein